MLLWRVAKSLLIYVRKPKTHYCRNIVSQHCIATLLWCCTAISLRADISTLLQSSCNVAATLRNVVATLQFCSAIFLQRFCNLSVLCGSRSPGAFFLLRPRLDVDFGSFLPSFVICSAGVVRWRNPSGWCNCQAPHRM